MATRRQRDAAQKIHENPRKPIGTIMREVGYSESTAIRPKDLTNSKGWIELMEEYYPDHKVEAVLGEALEANRSISVISGSKANGQTVDFVDVPDWNTRMDAVKEIHKVKNKYPREREDSSSKVFIVNINGINRYQSDAVAS